MDKQAIITKCIEELEQAGFSTVQIITSKDEVVTFDRRGNYHECLGVLSIYYEALKDTSKLVWKEE